jgi:AcrR family transcriptional regulator
LTNPAPDNTRDRLLIQAEHLFAQKGFAAVSVREITAAADTNLAAINYHFGNKTNLYLSVFKERWVPRAQGVRKFFKNSLSEKHAPETSDVVRAIATAFLEGPMTDDERRCQIALMQRELAHPTKAVNIVVSEVIRPMHHDIQKLIRPSLPESINIEQLTLSIFSIISMIIYFGFAQPVVSRVMNQEFDPQFKSRVIDHIVSFTMGGITGIKEETV